jgi:hypothetical protein
MEEKEEEEEEDSEVEEVEDEEGGVGSLKFVRANTPWRKRCKMKRE